MPLDQQNFQLETNIKTLPDKPSELIRVALLDLEKAEKSPDYVISMGDWHQHYDGEIYPESQVGKCGVCLAGCVMAFSLGADRTRSLVPSKFERSDRNKLEALDEFRAGRIEDGFRKLGIGEAPFEYYRVQSYTTRPAAFKRDMENLADKLGGAGF